MDNTININGVNFNVLDEEFGLAHKAPQDCTMSEVLKEIERVAELCRESYMTLHVATTNSIRHMQSHYELCDRAREASSTEERLELLPQVIESCKKLTFLWNQEEKVIKSSRPLFDQLSTIGRFVADVPIRTVDDVMAMVKIQPLVNQIRETNKKHIHAVQAFADMALEARNHTLENA